MFVVPDVDDMLCHVSSMTSMLLPTSLATHGAGTSNADAKPKDNGQSWVPFATVANPPNVGAVHVGSNRQLILRDSDELAKLSNRFPKATQFVVLLGGMAKLSKMHLDKMHTMSIILA